MFVHSKFYNKMASKVISLIVLFVLTISVNGDSDGYNSDIYEKALDPELCQRQLKYIVNNSTMLRVQLLDAGIRFPRGIFDFNFLDMGNYFQCLDINHEIMMETSSLVQGKYCSIDIPITQYLQTTLSAASNIAWPEGWPEMTWNELVLDQLQYDKQWIQDLRKINSLRSGQRIMYQSLNLRRTGGLSITVAVCIPKVCTTREAISYLYFNTPVVGLEYSDNFCRLPNDKPWTPADYIATIILLILGVATLISTIYDVYFTLIRKKDPEKGLACGQIFSIYTNTKRVLTFSSNASTLSSLDGIRTIAMLWIIIGHSFSVQTSGRMANPRQGLTWMESKSSLWILPLFVASVDTFLMLSGVLIVYSTIQKYTQRQFRRNLPQFYLKRLFRKFPILLTAVLLQASLLNRVADGPFWDTVLYETQKCRDYWWPTLLYIQNYYNPSNICLGHTWYLAINVQLIMISPFIIFWVLNGKKSVACAWAALIGALLASLIVSIVYNFERNFPGSTVTSTRPLYERIEYFYSYYMNTLTRASPFFVGMLVGYILHLGRVKKINISKPFLSFIWVLAIIVGALCLYSHYPINLPDWNNQTVIDLVNTFERPAWAMILGWIIIACDHGYADPVNWVLSLPLWKLPSRLSYAVYIFHFPLMHIVSAMAVSPFYFSISHTIQRFYIDLVLAFLVAFLATILIDFPFSIMFKNILSKTELSTSDNCHKIVEKQPSLSEDNKY